MFSNLAALLREHPTYQSVAAAAAAAAPHLATAASIVVKAGAVAAPHIAAAATKASASAALIAAPHVAHASVATAVGAGDAMHYSLLSGATVMMPDMAEELEREADLHATLAANCLVTHWHAHLSLLREQGEMAVQLSKAESCFATYALVGTTFFPDCAF